MTFRERLDQIDEEQKISAALAGIEKETNGEVAEPPAPPYTEEGVPVHCSECGSNTFREEHSAIMCSNCGHGPFCNYCWNRHVREFHPLLVGSYQDARRGIRRRAQFLNHYLIRTVVKPAGFVLALLALLLLAYYSYLNQNAGSTLETTQAAAQPPGAALMRPGAEPAQEPEAPPAGALASETAQSPVGPLTKTPAAAQTTAGATSQTPVVETAQTTKASPASTPATTPAPAATSAPGTAAHQAPGAGQGEAQGAQTARAPLEFAAGGAVPLELVSLTSPVARKNTASLTIRTAATAACTIQVRYRSGPSRSADLGPQTAGGDGTITWSWRVGARTAVGNWPIDIACESGNHRAQLSAAVKVVE
jgi:hypothetical protein